MASSLDMRSFLKPMKAEAKFGRGVEAQPGGGFYNHHLKSKQQLNRQMIIARACLVSNLDYNNCSSAVSSSSKVYLDPTFGTDDKREKQRRWDNDKRENKVGVGGEQVPNISNISAEKLDEWMMNSVSEIVKNIGDAPLLVHIYSSKSKGETSSVESPPTTIPIPIIEKRKAEPKSWAGITRSWEEGSLIPDGIILVEQLKGDNNNNKNEKEGPPCMGNSCGSTKTWGVVIQGRGADSASSCFILKTCRVGSSLGFCTHFCLVRAKCFGETADIQLKNSWLLGQ